MQCLKGRFPLKISPFLSKTHGLSEAERNQGAENVSRTSAPNSFLEPLRRNDRLRYRMIYVCRVKEAAIRCRTGLYIGHLQNSRLYSWTPPYRGTCLIPIITHATTYWEPPTEARNRVARLTPLWTLGSREIRLGR